MEISDLYLLAGISLEESRYQQCALDFVNEIKKVPRFYNLLFTGFECIHDQSRFR